MMYDELPRTNVVEAVAAHLLWALLPIGEGTPGIDEAVTAAVLDRAWAKYRAHESRYLPYDPRAIDIGDVAFYVTAAERRSMLRTLEPWGPMAYAPKATVERIFGMRLVAAPPGYRWAS